MPKTAKVRQPDNSPYIVIAGGAGFLGSHLTESLLLSGARVIGLDNLVTGNLSNIASFKRHPRYEFFECNINQGLPKALTDKPITHVVHTIGLETHALDQQLTLGSMLTGSFATKNLLDLAVAKGATFLLTSSISVYQGLASSTNLNYYFGSDSEQRATFSMYEAKRYAEALVEMYVRQYNLDARIARLSQLYGPRMDILDSSFLDQLLQQVLSGQDLVVKEEGSQELYLTYIADAVYGLSRLLFAQGPQYRQTIYPIVNQEKISVLSVAYTLRSYLPAGKEVQFVSTQPPALSNLPAVSMERTKRDLDWEANTSLTQGLKQTVEYFQQNKPASLKHTVPSPDQISTVPSGDFVAANSVARLPAPTSDVSPTLAYRGGVDLTKAPRKEQPLPATPELSSKKPNQEPTKRSTKSWVRRLFVIGLLAVVYLAWGQPVVHASLASVYAVYQINQGVTASKQLHFDQAEQLFGQAQQAFSTASQQWQRLSFIAKTFNLNTQYRQIDQTLQSSVAASEGLTILAHTAQPWPEQLKKMIPKNLSQSMTYEVNPDDQKMINMAHQTKQDLQRVQRQFGRALVALSEPQSNTQVAGATLQANHQETIGQASFLSNFHQYLRSNIAQAQLLITQADQFIDVLPTLTGNTGPKNYLIMLQNSNELRPTGGFTGSYIALSFDQGQLTSFMIDDIYNPDGQIKDTADARASLPDKEAANAIPLRDANWFADIPTSAKLISQRYKQATGKSVDGLAFVTIQAIKPLLRHMGSVYLPYFDKTVTADNFDILAQTYSNVNYTAGSTNKKDFLGQFAQAIINRLTADRSADWPTVGQTVGQGLNTKEIQLYSTDPSTTLLINQHNWGGITTNTSNDYLRIIDANVAGNKSNYYVSRATAYDINVDRQGDLNAVLTINWDHKGQSATWPGGDFVNYVRVYVPAGANLYASSGFDQAVALKKYLENGKQVFAGQVTIPYGHQSSVELRYTLPSTLGLADTQQHYQLDWQKQSGIVDEPLAVRFNMPSYLSFTSGSSDPHLDNQTVRWNVTGRTDTSLSAAFVDNL